MDYDRGVFTSVAVVLRQDLLMTSLENATIRLGALRDERKNLLICIRALGADRWECTSV